MNIVFEPLTVTHTDAMADGVLVLLLSVFGPVIAANDGFADGALVLGGEAVGEVVDDRIQPQIPPIADGVLSLAIEAEGDVHIDGETDVTLALDGLAAVGPIADGGVVVRGEALQVPPLTAYGFLVEQSPQVVSYGGLWFDSLEDGLIFGEQRSAAATAVLRALLALDEQSRNAFDGSTAAADDIVFGQRLTVVYLVLVAEGVRFAPMPTADYRMLERAINRVLLSGAACGVADAIAAVTTGLVFGTLLEVLALASTGEALALNAHIGETYTAVEQLVIALLLDAAAAPSHSATILIDEGLLARTDLESEAAFAQLVSESLGFAATLSLDSGDYIAWVLNTESKGLSRYTRYPYNSFAKLGDAYYGAASDGLYRLDGDTDAGVPITARLRLGLYDLGTRKLKRLPEAYLGYSSTGTLLLRVISIEQVTGEKQAAIYQLKPRQAANTRENRFTIGRGIKSVDWDFEIENVNGADFDLTSIEFRPLVLDRRTRG